MRVLLKSVEVIDARYSFHRKKRNILIKNGIISSITTQDVSSDKVIEGKGLIVSIGWFDMRASFCDPGFEQKEDIVSGSRAAHTGGFTEVALLPNTNPVIQTKNEISYIIANNSHSLVQLHPMACATVGTEGEAITEMIDLYQAGAVAFTDGEKPIWHTDVLLKSLQYLQKFDGLLINRAEDQLLTTNGTMNEGVTSTQLGLKGIPNLSEELMIERDIKLLRYAGGRIHFSNISTENSVELIRQAKKKGLSITCDVAAHQLAFDDSALRDFDTNFKVNPPLRSKKDVKALINGLKDGTIDVIVSSHTPQDEESKKLEFDLAEFGVTGLQTVYPVLNSLEDLLDLNLLIEKITISPRAILHLPIPEIKVGSPANLTVFDPEQEWVLDDHSNQSKSRNSPFYNQTLRGKVAAVFNNGKWEINR